MVIVVVSHHVDPARVSRYGCEFVVRPPPVRWRLRHGLPVALMLVLFASFVSNGVHGFDVAANTGASITAPVDTGSISCVDRTAHLDVSSQLYSGVSNFFMTSCSVIVTWTGGGSVFEVNNGIFMVNSCYFNNVAVRATLFDVNAALLVSVGGGVFNGIYHHVARINGGNDVLFQFVVFDGVDTDGDMFVVDGATARLTLQNAYVYAMMARFV